jgi:hypothetical protein
VLYLQIKNEKQWQQFFDKTIAPKSCFLLEIKT